MDKDAFKKDLLHFPVSSEKTHRAFEFMGYAMPAFEVAYGRSDLRRVKPRMDEDIEKRLDDIAKLADSVCFAVEKSPKTLKPLAHGKDGVVFEVDEDTVLRIQRGKSKPRFEDPDLFLQPDFRLYSTPLNVTFEVLPKAKMDVTPAEMTKVAQDAKDKHGIVVWDQILSNFGRKKDGSVVILDPDSYQLPKRQFDL